MRSIPFTWTEKYLPQCYFVCAQFLCYHGNDAFHIPQIRKKIMQCIAPHKLYQSVLREKLGDLRSKKKNKIFMYSGTYQIIPYTHFITRMSGFPFILCVVLTIYCSAADRFQKWQEDDIQQEGLCVACGFTNKGQQALLATGRRWINNQTSKFRRKIARSCRNKSNDTYNGVSSVSLLFLLFLAGDIELNPGPAVTSSNSHSESSV